MSNNSSGWGSRVGLILAMAGNAVGLGNFLRFPAQAVENGGGAFIIPYLVCFLLMGIPLLWIEWTMGRYGGRFGNHSTPFILDNMTKKRFWKYFGVFGIFTNIAVAAYYCYIESWTLSYAIHSAKGTFDGMSSEDVSTFFGTYLDTSDGTFLGIPGEAIWIYIGCLALNIYILSKGLSGGVEKVAKIGMPLLLGFGAFLAIRGLTLGTGGASEACPDCNAYEGINFLWQPNFDSLANPKVWLAAAGQIFFTLSVGMGTIHCYAAYVRSKDDIALNAMSAGWMNGFVEVVLGASVVVPLAVGYFGMDWLGENGGFTIAFKSMPYMFEQWGAFFSAMAGIMWFGLLFFAGITSSLAMGTPWMGFMRDEFGWSDKKSAWSFGGLVLLVGLPTVLFFNQGVFDEYDYWAGTVSLVVFAMAEVILFGWIFGIENGWAELKRGADLRVPNFYKPIMKYVTPVFILVVFLGALAAPKSWDDLLNKGKYELSEGSIIGQFFFYNIPANKSISADYWEAEKGGTVHIDKSANDLTVSVQNTKKYWTNLGGFSFPYKDGETKLPPGHVPFDTVITDYSKTIAASDVRNVPVSEGQTVNVGDKLIETNSSHWNKTFWVILSRTILFLLFLFICFLVYKATMKRLAEGRINA